ncbi:MAG TPA: lipoyl synthase [candidate division Zixibacteria bacterium]|nr:lipoyl synthase [candidate division Zixibacteria bacterium]
MPRRTRSAHRENAKEETQVSISKPRWMKRNLPVTPEGKEVRNLLSSLHLNTVCREANCPNRGQCFSEGTATFLIMGDVCTRDCRFCNIAGGTPRELEDSEPRRVAEASAKMNLKHVVITSVTRDDLPDGGASHFAATIDLIHEKLPEATVEVLIPDLMGNEDALEIVLNSKPDVLNHNVETVPELYSAVRPKAVYASSMRILELSKNRGFITKSGLMVGLGETDEQFNRTIAELAGIGLDILTIGQYSAPSERHYPVKAYIHPDRFEEMAEFGENAGIGKVVAGPLVRSSFRAGIALKDVLAKHQTKSA